MKFTFLLHSGLESEAISFDSIWKHGPEQKSEQLLCGG